MLNHVSTALRAVAASICLSLSLSANATIVPLGDSVATLGTTLAARPELAITNVTNVLLPWSDGKGSSGTLFAMVGRESGGTLDFYFQIRNDETSLRPVDTLRIGDSYGAFIVDVDYRIDTDGSIGSSSAGWTLGNTGLFFSFIDDVIDPGEASHFLFVRTNATNFGAGIADLLLPDGPTHDASDVLTVFAPRAVPEPTSLLLLASGLVAIRRGVRICRIKCIALR